MTKELTNIIQLIKANEFELAYQLLIGNPWIYMDCSDDDFTNLYYILYCIVYGYVIEDNNLIGFNKTHPKQNRFNYIYPYFLHLIQLNRSN